MTLPSVAAHTGAPDMRRRILEAAVRCFARSGFHGGSMQEICSEAQMSAGALYRYFPSKDTIIEAIATEERTRNAEFTSRLDVERDVLDTLCDTGFAHMRDMIARGQSALCAEVCAEAQRNPRIRSIFAANHAEVHGAIRKALAKAQALGEVSAEIDLDVAATMLMAIGDGLIVRMPFEAESGLDQIQPKLKDLVRRMLAPERAESMKVQ